MNREPNVVLDEDLLTVLRLISKMDLALGISVTHSFGRPANGHIATLRAQGYIGGQLSRRLDGTPALLYRATEKGKAALAAATETNPALERSASRAPLHPETYSGAELRPFSGRAGALDAFRIPSRVGNRLRFRAVTDVKADESHSVRSDGKDRGHQS